MVLSGDEGAYGHRKLGGIGSITGDVIGRITGEGIVLQQVAYLMRSGSPDSLDLMVATNYAVMASDLVLEGASGRMVALRGGTYTNVPISVTGRGQAGRRRRAVRRRAVPPEGPPRRRQTHVPLLILPQEGVDQSERNGGADATGRERGISMTLAVSTLDGDTTKVEDDELEELRAQLSGEVLTAADEGSANPIYNAMHDRRPALKVRATGTADVVDTINFARQRNLLVAVRGGGHSVAGLSACDGGLVIDLTRMRAVTVDPVARRASVQGGALWRDVDRESQAFGLVVPGGVVSETGVAGLTLGGGEGWVRRKYGLTIDSLRAATVVCADGSVHVASADQDEDLFWALRGGGGNFGVVTHFDFDAHPLGPIVAFAGVMYSTRDAGEILPPA